MSILDTIDSPRKSCIISSLLLAAAVVLIAFGAWMLLHSSAGSEPKSFAECQELPDSTTLESYPEQCVTSASKHFTNPQTTVVKPPTSTAVTIAEWKLRITVNETDAIYTFNANDTAYLTTKRLDSLVAQAKGCTSGLHGLTISHKAAVVTEVSQIEPACVPETNGLTTQITTIKQHLRDALKTAKATT